VLRKDIAISSREACKINLILALRSFKIIFIKVPTFLLNNQENIIKQAKIKVSSFNNIMLLKVSSVNNNKK
jgi:hypothetical protein